MTELEINKIIHEKLMRKCWHEFVMENSQNSAGITVWIQQCNKCVWHKYAWTTSTNPSYTSSWADYGKALERFKAHELFGDFLEWFIKENKLNEIPLDNALMIFFDVMTCLKCDTTHGAGIIAEYFKQKAKVI